MCKYEWISFNRILKKSKSNFGWSGGFWHFRQKSHYKLCSIVKWAKAFNKLLYMAKFALLWCRLQLRNGRLIVWQESKLVGFEKNSLIVVGGVCESNNMWFCENKFITFEWHQTCFEPTTQLRSWECCFEIWAFTFVPEKQKSRQTRSMSVHGTNCFLLLLFSFSLRPQLMLCRIEWIYFIVCVSLFD